MPSYISNLTDSIIESYTGIIYGLKEAKNSDSLDPFVPKLFEFLTALCQNMEIMKPDLQKAVGGLIGDLIDLYDTRAKTFAQSPFLTKLMQILEESKLKDHMQVAKWLKNCITKATK